MIHEKTVIDNNNVRFSNDLFFKYLLSRDTLESKKLRKFIVKSVTHLDCQQMIVKNPEINQNTVLAKNIILDICALMKRAESLISRCRWLATVIVKVQGFSSMGPDC